MSRAPAAEQLLAGFAKVDITPPHPRGMSLLGMGRVYPGAHGVLDPIHARACYIGTRSDGALLLVLDTVFSKVLRPHQDEIIAGLARCTGLPATRIWILCTHCHSSFGEAFDQTWTGGDHYRIRTLSAYMEHLLPRVVAVGEDAFRRRVPAEIGYAAAPVSGVGSSRRVRTADGIVLSAWANGPCPPPGMRPIGRGPHDPDVGLVVFRDRRRHRPIGALINYSSHIHLYPTLNFTAELAGAVVRRLERRHQGMLAIYTNGAEGTISLDQFLPPQSPRPEDWDRQYLAQLALFSRRMQRGIDAAWKQLSFRGRVRLRGGDRTVRMRIQDVGGNEVRLAQPLKALAIDDLALLGEQEEAWCELALDIKARSPFPSTFVLGFTGFRNRYFPTAHGIEEGGYESQIRYLDGDGFERTVAGAVSLLGRLRRGIGR